MKSRTLILCLPLLYAPASFSAPDAKTDCAFTLSGGTLNSGTLLDATTTTAVLVGAVTIQSGSRIKSGALSKGTITSAVSKGGSYADTKCVDTRLTDATFSSVSVAGAVIFNDPGSTADKTVTLAAATNFVLGKAVVDKAEISNPTVPAPSKTSPTMTTIDPTAPLAGDWFKFNVDVQDARLAKADGEQEGLRVTIPADACFRVTAEIEEADGAAKRKIARGTLYTKAALWQFWSWGTPPYMCETEKVKKAIESACESQPSAADQDKCIKSSLRRAVDIPVTLLNDTTDRSRFGFTYGIMVAPFKYYRESKTFDAGAQVGPYIGYRIWDRQGSSTVLALGVGASSARVSTTTGSGTTEETKNGLSWAVGFLTEFKNSFNVGLLWGMDMYSKADAVPRSGDHWLSVSFGYKLNP